MISKLIIVLWTLIMVFNFLGGASNMNDDGMISGGEAILLIVVNGFIWALVVVPTALVGMLFRKRREAP